ncbi:MAG: hypothetical protein K6G62_02785 [Eubacterium sp.]|nr:hypothetical protein [Eubacterium sp.]
MIISMVGVTSIILLLTIQGAVNMDSKNQHDLRAGLTLAMTQTMNQLKQEKMQESNQYIALLMEGLISRLDTDMDLTLKVHSFDPDKKELEVEAIGSYVLPGNVERRVSVRRRAILEGH